ncbi:hypothetical protein [Jiangella muralis]|uniref:hypothetical protein n=1 Tax=Jiangella muralis TaxID=702383 RepID=UPI00069FB1D4|nr:hypothetical protein [Jiangella muralis]
MVLSLGRPRTLLVLGIFALLVGALFAAITASVHARPAAGTPVCEQAFARGCLTERTVLTVDVRTDAGNWLAGTRTWELAVPGDWPYPVRPEASIRSQPPDDELRTGGRVTAVFEGPEVLGLRLPSGVALESEFHPRFAVPVNAAIALLAAGIGLMTIGFAVSTAREFRSWTVDAVTPVVGPNVGMAVALLGAVAFAGVRAYPRPAPIAYLAIGVAALASVLIVRHRRSPKSRERFRSGRLTDELRRLMAADPVPVGNRHNGHLYLVARPKASSDLVPHPARLAAAVERLLGAHGADEFWPGLGRLDWEADGDGVWLTHGVRAGRVDEDDLLVLTVAADGTISLLCGRGTTPRRPDGRERSRGEPEVRLLDPVLVRGLTRTVLVLAGERSGSATHVEWSLSLYLDRLWSAAARDDPPGGPLSRSYVRPTYQRTIQASGRMLRERSDAVAGQLAGPLLGVPDAPPGAV